MCYLQQNQDTVQLVGLLLEGLPDEKTFPEGSVEYPLGHWSFPPELMVERKLMGHRPRGEWIEDTEMTYVVGNVHRKFETGEIPRMSEETFAMYRELGNRLYEAPVLIDATAGIVRWPKVVAMGWSENGDLITVQLTVAHFQYHTNPYQGD